MRVDTPNDQVPQGVDANEHTHAFYRDGDDKRVVEVEVYVISDVHSYALTNIDYEVDATAGKDRLVGRVTAGIKDLLGELPLFVDLQISATQLFVVLKSTGSAFHGYIHDEYTTLVEVDDRILSTSIDLSYTFAPFDIQAPTDEQKLTFSIPQLSDTEVQGSVWDCKVSEGVRAITMNTFADDDSASVQVGFLIFSCFY